MKDSETGLTLEFLKTVLRYDPSTGTWTWLAPSTRWSRIKVGSEAGTISEGRYHMITVCGFQYKSHRLAFFYMTGKWPPSTMDHEDLDKTNNKWTNIRPATRQENGRNYPRQANNTSGRKCVSFDKRRGKFRAHIYVSKRQKWLGYHDTAEQAHAAYADAARELFGDFARIE